MNQERPSTDQVVSLASLLNMLWRQRLFVLGLPALGLVVALLYGIFSPRSWGATVTVRPGITAFGPDGTAVRQWRLKDITRWYDKQLYAREVVQRLGLPSGSRIVIESEYMAPGLHDYVGGDVITLWTIARSPELAAAILDSSIQVFSEFSETETVGSQLQLTRDHLELQIRRQEANLSRLQAEELLLGLQIESSRAESLLVHVEDGHLRLEL